MDFTALFVDVDDFWFDVQETFHQDGKPHRRRNAQLSDSEIITILIAFQTRNYRTFKYFDSYLQRHHNQDFPGLLSYNRFVEWIPQTALPMFDYLVSDCLGTVTGIKVCNNKNLFDQLYARGLKLITNVCKNMKNKLLDWQEHVLLRKRSLIETVNDQLKTSAKLNTPVTAVQPIF